MNLAVDHKMTKDEFLLWVQAQEGRYEFKNGRIAMMHGGTLRHSVLVFELAAAITARLNRKLWSTCISDFAVEIGNDIRYPDIVIESSSGDPARLSTATPAFVAEVLSPSSLALDLHIKAEEYMSLPSLQAYLVAAQDQPRVWLWTRGADGAFPKAPEMIEGKTGTFVLQCFDCAVPLSVVYQSLQD